jgi:hypothetical protein
MKIAKHSVSIRPAQGWAGLIACVLLFANSATAQDMFENATSNLQIELQNDLVTISARNVRLRDVLTEIVRQSGLTVFSRAPLDARLTLEIEELPLTEVLVRIMRGQSYMLHQAGPTTDDRMGNNASADTLWVFSDDSSDESAYSLSATSMAIELLRSQLASDDIRARQKAVNGLRMLRVNEVVEPLSYALADKDRKVRIKAIYALADIGGNDAVAILAGALADENAWVRAETAHALAAIGGDTAIPVLKHALYDADSRVRTSAISAFVEIGGTESADALAIALQDTDPEVRVEAVAALRNVGGETAIRILNKALQDRDVSVREAAREAFAGLSHHRDL